MDVRKEGKKHYHYVRLSWRRYGELTGKKDKGAFLAQFCAAMGMNAIRRLPSGVPLARCLFT